MNYTFNEIGLDAIGSIRKAWLKLNEEHQERSKHFKEFYASRSFDEWVAPFLTLREEDINIEVVTHKTYNVVGYCITTVHGSKGNVDSLFIDERFRDKGIGTTLMVNALHWLKERKIEDIGLHVSQGNEHVLKFYERFSFYPKHLMLAYKSPRD